MDKVPECVSELTEDLYHDLASGSTSIVENVKIWYVGSTAKSPQKTPTLLLKTKFGKKMAAAEFDEMQKKKTGKA